MEIVCGDTKVVEYGKGDQIYINTCTVVFMAREDIPVQRSLMSDCALLCKAAAAAMVMDGIWFLCDLTRGGLATTCIELIEHTPWEMEMDKSAIPIDEDVKTLCSLLGFNPMYLNCKGRMIAIIRSEEARIIGGITKEHPQALLLKMRLPVTSHLLKKYIKS